MKRSFLTILLAAAFSAQLPAFAAGDSEALSLATASTVGSVAFGAVLVMSAPFLIVADLSRAANAKTTTVNVRDGNGNPATIELPHSVVEKAGLAPGDELTVQRRNAGVILSKNAKPVAYVVAPKNAELSKNVELKR